MAGSKQAYTTRFILVLPFKESICTRNEGFDKIVTLNFIFRSKLLIFTVVEVDLVFIMENCCESIVKYFMVLCNILFALAGIILIGFGAYAQIAAKDYLNFLGDNYVNTPIFVIILGMILN